MLGTKIRANQRALKMNIKKEENKQIENQGTLKNVIFLHNFERNILM